MKRLLTLIALFCATASSAQACWESPSADCFERAWQDLAIAEVQRGPQIEMLYELIAGGLVPPGADTAKALLGDLSYEDLKAHAQVGYEAEKAKAEGVEPPPSGFDIMQRLLGMSDQPVDPLEHLKAPDPYFVSGIYRLVAQTEDVQRLTEWYTAIPRRIRVGEYLNPPVGLPDAEKTALPNAGYYDAQGATIATLERLSHGDLDGAMAQARLAQGEPRFMAWKAIARHAIDTDDMQTLRQAVAALAASHGTRAEAEMDEETLNALIAAANDDYARTGDPDALVHAYEGSEGLGEVDARAWPAIYLADRVLYQRTGQSVLGATALEDWLATLPAADDHLDLDTELMHNAQSAWHLGLKGEAIAMIDTAFETSNGMPFFLLGTLPETPTPFARFWFVEMQKRFDHIRANPGQYDQRRYWGIWVDQELLGNAHDITEFLARYESRAAARAFAEDVAEHLKEMARRYPDEVAGPDTFDGFLAEVAPWIYDAEKVIAMRHADPKRYHNGERDYAIAEDLARAGQVDAAITLVSFSDEALNVDFWMEFSAERPAQDRPEYFKWLTFMIDREAGRLRAGYPTLEQDLWKKATVFWAVQGQWDKSKAAFDRLSNDTEDGYRRGDAYWQMQIFKELSEKLAPPSGPTFSYPYEDFSL